MKPPFTGTKRTNFPLMFRVHIYITSLLHRGDIYMEGGKNDCVCWREKLGAQKYNICCLFLLLSLTHRVSLPNLFLKGFAESFTRKENLVSSCDPVPTGVMNCRYGNPFHLALLCANANACFGCKWSHNRFLFSCKFIHFLCRQTWEPALKLKK